MKKVTLILSALALVLGLSQCKKQEEPVANGQKQHIVLTADNGNDGSKVSADFVSANLNLTWDGDEVITVSGGATGTLDKITVDQSNLSKATFEGDITKGEGDVVFTIGSAPSSYANQTGTADGCAAWINANNHFVGTSQWQDNGNYNVTMELQYAVLKLDVSALGTTGEMTIAAGATVASVTDVASSEGKAVFVAVPTDETEKAYTITCGGKTATKTWKLEKNVFYTKAGAEGAGTGDAIVIEPTTPKFTVGDGKTVEFAPGNLYWDGSKFKFEANQWDFASTWDANHVSHFFWSNTTDWQTSGKEPYAESYSCNTQTTGDVFFTNAMETTANPDFHMDGETGKNQWRTLSNGEWAYLLNTSGSSGRTDAIRFAKAKVKDVCGLLIFPDNYSGTASGTGIADVNATEDVEFPTFNIPDDTWKAMESAGAVFLPAAGYRLNTDVDYVSEGYYWSSTPHNSIKGNAYYMRFNSQDVYTNSRSRNRNGGLSVRLVR